MQHTHTDFCPGSRGIRTLSRRKAMDLRDWISEWMRLNFGLAVPEISDPSNLVCTLLPRSTEIVPAALPTLLETLESKCSTQVSHVLRV